MTNGDMIKDFFNPYKICEYEHSVHVYMTEEDFWKSDYQINCNTSWWNAPCNKEKESATVAKFHDFYPEDPETWPPADKEILVKNHVGDNFIAYLGYDGYSGYDDGEDGGWGFYSEDGDFIADLDDIDAWMPIPQHERDKDYIPVWEREKKTISAETHDDEEDEEKDR